MVLLQRLEPISSKSRALQATGVWLKIPLRNQSTIILWREKFPISCELLDCWLDECSAPIRWTSSVPALLLVVSSCWRLSSEWRFALRCGGELLDSSVCSVKFSTLFLCSMVLLVEKFCNVIWYKAQQRWEFNLYASKKLQ